MINVVQPDFNFSIDLNWSDRITFYLFDAAIPGSFISESAYVYVYGTKQYFQRKSVNSLDSSQLADDWIFHASEEGYVSKIVGKRRRVGDDGDEKVKVAILDTGYDKTHPLFCMKTDLINKKQSWLSSADKDQMPDNLGRRRGYFRPWYPRHLVTSYYRPECGNLCREDNEECSICFRNG